jgi:hypothetical protein
LIGVAYFLIDMPMFGKLFVDTPADDFAGIINDTKQGLGIPFMMVGPILTVVCVLIYVVRSYQTPAIAAEEVAKVCWDHPLSFLSGKITGASDPSMVTLYLIGSVAFLYAMIQILAK